MNRINPTPRSKIIGGAAVLAALLLSGALGYRLDWTAGREASGEDEEEAELSAAAGNAVAEAAAEPEAAAEEVPADPRASSWGRMVDELEHLAARHRGRVAIELKDLRDGKTWTYHPDDLFPSASLIKVPIMACVFFKIKDGGLSLSDRLSLQRRHRRGGSGNIKWRADGTRMTVQDLLFHMITESDNTATAMLIEALGYGYISAQFSKMGLFYTEIYPEGMSIKGGRVARENYTTAREMTMLMEKIYRGDLVDRESSELMLEILKHKRATASRLAKGLPSGWELAHKTGLLRQACHDVAIVLSPGGSYALTVLTGQNSNYKAAKDFISRLGRVTYRHYRGQTYVAKAPGKRHPQIALR